MRKILITIILFGAIINSKSELQHFFPDSNACFSVSWMKFWFEGDTIIENLKYKKVYVQGNDSIFDFSKAQYFAAIREDTIAEKVYCHFENYYYSAGEFLLYDFSVEVGDVVEFYTLWPWVDIPEMKSQVVISIDDVFIDGNLRKRINFKDGYSGKDDSWIEGIGSIRGIFFPGPWDIWDIMDPTILLCVHIDNRLIYEVYSYYAKNCFLPSSGSGIDKREINPLRIYPTIADDFLYFETDFILDDFDYKIINMQGQTMEDGKITSEIINVSTLSKGFYLVLILDNNKNIYRQKFVKR
ncbi:MAG: T9SS type A sorting domain-containing protein [Marinilabiliaceae bacterium]|nr:T9SS type A sorting domain-containing protein [Marinilabiliaceae bacterium]